MMLPDEVIELSCRGPLTMQITVLLQSSVPLLVAHGLTATGKSSTIRNCVTSKGAPYALLNCRETVTGRHLLERTTASCLDALDAFHVSKTDRRPYARTENISTLAVHLQRMLEGEDKPFTLVFDGIDKQREAPPTLIAALARFVELIPNLSIIFITTLPIPHALHKPGVPHIHFPSYTRGELLIILSQNPPKIFLTPPSEDQYPDYTPDLAAEDDAWLWGRFLAAVYESLAKHTGRDLVSFRNTAMRLWRPFVQPVVDGQFGTRDFSRLMVNRRHLFQGEDAVLDSILPKGSGAPKVLSSRALEHSLPFYAKYMLISAYLASYNPSRTDPTYFMSHSDKRKNKRKVNTGGATKHRRVSRHLLSPGPFPLDRLLSIFRALVGTSVPQTMDLSTQIATLTSMRLLVKSGAGDDKWRVNFGFEFARGLGRTVGVEVGEYLVGGVDG